MNRRYASLAMLALLAGCSDRQLLPVVEDPAPPAQQVQHIACTVEVAARSMRCAPAGAAAGVGARSDLIVGGQGVYVQLANGGITLDGDIFSTPVTLQNLTALPLGTANGSTPSPSGVRVFFHERPTNGVEVANADGTATYTGNDQPYFQYSGILNPQQTSPARLWSFRLNGATSFTFSVYVVAEVMADDGFIRVSRTRGSATENDLRDVWLRGDTAIAVASSGSILRSVDGGQSWKLVDTGQSRAHHAVTGIGSTVVVVGFLGVIVRSMDRGATWSPVPSGTAGKHLADVTADPHGMIAVGAAGTIVISWDDGVTWTPVNSGVTTNLNSVWRSGNLAIAAGQNGVILRSTDYGVTWQPVSTGTTATFVGVWGQGDTIVLVGSVIFRSVDGGATWTQPLGPGPGFSLGAVSGAGGTLVAVGGQDHSLSGVPYIYRSTDSGATWTRILPSSLQGSLTGISADGSVLLAVGGTALLRSIDGGITWKDVSGVEFPMRGVWGSGSVVLGVNATFIFRSSDLGRTWTTVEDFPSRYHHFAVWGEGSSFVVVGRGVLRSFDAGVTWTTMREPDWEELLPSVHGHGSTVFVVGGLSDSGRALRSDDGGSTLREVYSHLWLRAVWTNGTAVIALAGEYVVRSTDRGGTWTSARVSPVSLNAVWGVGDTVIAVGQKGHILRSVNAGATWTAVSSGTTQELLSVHGVGATVVAVGAAGTILRSLDLGETWHPIWSGVDHEITGVWMADARTGVAVGSRGLVLRLSR